MGNNDLRALVLCFDGRACGDRSSLPLSDSFRERESGCDAGAQEAPFPGHTHRVPVESPFSSKNACDADDSGGKSIRLLGLAPIDVRTEGYKSGD